MDMVAVQIVPVTVVSCANVTVPPGPSSGDIQKTAPSLTSIPADSVHSAIAMPMVLIAPELLPSVGPTVSHESNSASALNAQNAGFVPPRSAPNGAGTWKAAGTDITSAESPKMV